jgi:hypothetical protein
MSFLPRPKRSYSLYLRWWNQKPPTKDDTLYTEKNTFGEKKKKGVGWGVQKVIKVLKWGRCMRFLIRPPFHIPVETGILVEDQDHSLVTRHSSLVASFPSCRRLEGLLDT